MAGTKTNVFISYKTGSDTGLTFQARAIKKELEEWPDSDYSVFFDKDNLEAGLDWNTQIYETIPVSDVLLLLLAPETSNSDWVRREIDVAKGAQVTVLPVLIRSDFDLQAALDKFDIPRVQAVNLTEGDTSQYEALFTAIEQRKGETEQRQKELLTRAGRREASTPIASPDPNYEIYPRQKKASPKIHIAAGSIMEMRPIDVFVNTENDYMQMARVFDSRTVSSMLRYYGSYFDGANRLLDDTVQNELTATVKQEFTTRPLGLGTVVVTSAGHPESDLVGRNKARFIFHTATVSVQGDGAHKRLVPLQSDAGVKDAVHNTLMKVDFVNSKQGVISPEGSEACARQRQIAEAGKYEPIKSIIFPMMGTGQGGRRTENVAPLMARALKEFTLDAAGTTLEHIYLCGRTEETVAIVDAALKAEFAPEELE